MNRTGIAGWLRQHPIRAIGYAALVILLGSALWLFLGVRAGARDGLLTGLVQSETVKRWVQRDLSIRYAIQSVHVGPGGAGCGTALEVRGISISQLAAGAARADLDRVRTCTSLSATAESIRIGTEDAPQRFTVGQARVSWPSDLRLLNIGWNDAKGAILTVAGVRSQLPSLRSEIESARVLPSGSESLLAVSNTSTGTLHLHGESATLDESRTREVLVLIEQRADGTWNFMDVGARLLPEARRTLEMARASFSGAQRAVGYLRHLALVGAVLGIAIVCLVKFLLTRWAKSGAWRMGLIFGPAVVSLIVYLLFFETVSFASFAIISLVAGGLVAIFLWRVEYRQAADWHQRIEPAVVDLLSPLPILAPLVVYGFLGLIPSKFPDSESLTVSKSNITNVLVRGVSGLCPVSNLGDARMDVVNADGFSAALDLNAFAVRSLALDRAFLRGEAHSSVLPLDKIPFLPPAWKRSPTIGFCANAKVSSGDKGVPLPECPGARESQLATVSTAASVNFLERTANVTTAIQAAPAAFRVRAMGSLTGARIEKIESLPGSTVSLRDGSGQISWNRQISSQFKLQAIEYAATGARIGVDSIDVGSTIPPLCERGPMRTDVHLGPTRGVSRAGYDVDLKHLDTQFTSTDRGDVSLRSGIRGARITGRKPGETSPWLLADLPLMQFDLHGRMSGEALVPRQFIGEGAFAILDGNGTPTLRSAAPVRVRVDIWRGEMQIPEQSAVFEQSIVPRLPRSIPVRFSTDARLEALSPAVRAESRSVVQIPHLTLAVPPATLSLNELSLRAAWNTQSSLHVAYASGWNRIELPRLPRSLELKAVSTLDVRTEGNAKALPPPKAVLDDLQLIHQWARQNLPTVPEAVTFRIAGASPPTADEPLLSLTTQGGRSIRVKRASAGLTDLKIEGARFERAGSEVRVEGIANSKGAGNLVVEAKSTLTDKEVTVELARPIRAAISAEASHFALAVDEATPLAPLMDQLQPLLEEAGLHLNGVHLLGQLASLHSDVRFANGELSDLAADAALAPGPLAQIDLSKMLAPSPTEFLRTIEIRQGSPLSARISAPPATFPRLDASVSAPDVSLDLNEGEVEAKMAANAAVESSLGFAAARNTSAMGRLLQAVTGFGDHLGHAADVFGGALPPFEDIHWQMRLHGNGNAPVIRIEPERIDVSLLSDNNQVRWQSAGAPSIARSSFDLAASLENHSDHLIFDAEIPLRLAFSIGGAPEREWNLRLPLLVAIRDHLEPAPGGSSELWDSAYYERLWQSYQPHHATADASPLLNVKEIVFRGISLQQISLPAEPLRLAAGYAGPLQIHLPVRSSILYGSTEGTIQSRISWQDRAAAVDSATRFSFKDIQAGAFGLVLGGAPTPLLEDTLQGKIAVRTDGLLVDRLLLPRLTSDASQVAELDKLGIDLDLESQRDENHLPGVLQLETGVRPRLYNALLNELVRDVQLLAPSPTVRYQNLALRFAVDHGEVQTEHALLSLQGVEIPELSPFTIGGDVRVRWGSMPPGFASGKLRFRNLLYFLRRTFPLQGPN